MKPVDFMRMLLEVKETQVMRINLIEPKIQFVVTMHDALASRVLLAIADDFEERGLALTLNDLRAVLESAMFWTRFWAAQPEEETPGETPEPTADWQTSPEPEPAPEPAPAHEPIHLVHIVEEPPPDNEHDPI